MVMASSERIELPESATFSSKRDNKSRFEHTEEQWINFYANIVIYQNFSILFTPIVPLFSKQQNW